MHSPMQQPYTTKSQPIHADTHSFHIDKGRQHSTAVSAIQYNQNLESSRFACGMIMITDRKSFLQGTQRRSDDRDSVSLCLSLRELLLLFYFILFLIFFSYFIHFSYIYLFGRLVEWKEFYFKRRRWIWIKKLDHKTGIRICIHRCVLCGDPPPMCVWLCVLLASDMLLPSLIFLYAIFFFFCFPLVCLFVRLIESKFQFTIYHRYWEYSVCLSAYWHYEITVTLFTLCAEKSRFVAQW